MSNLFGIGLSGLSAAQSGLATASSNISNVNTPGYTRRDVTLAEVGQNDQNGGVSVTGIARRYADFVSGQRNAALSASAASQSHLDQISQIDNLLSDSEAGLAPRIQDFFDSLSVLAGSPQDMAARSGVLAAAGQMTARFRDTDSALAQLDDSVSTRLDAAVTELNDKAAGIARLNGQIAALGNSASANNLLDRRDQLVADTASLVNVALSVDEAGRYSLTVGGQPLVDATGSHALTSVASDDGSHRRQIGVTSADGSQRAIDSAQINGGELGGLLAFVNTSLIPARARLDQTAQALAAAVNAVHEQGLDLDGRAGQALFTSHAPGVIADPHNNGAARLIAQFLPQDSASLTTDDYRVVFDDTGTPDVTRVGDDTSVASVYDAEQHELSFGGLAVSIQGRAAAGDAFVIRPLAGAAAGFDLALTDPAGLAAGIEPGVGDARNADALTRLQRAPLIEGHASAAQGYAQLVGEIGHQTAALKIDADARSSLVDDLTQAQQSISGVNLDEESVNLMYYQQMYQANARVIQTASSVFDTLLSLGAG